MTVLFMIKTEDKTTGEIHKRSVSVKAEKNENYIDLRLYEAAMRKL